MLFYEPCMKSDHTQNKVCVWKDTIYSPFPAVFGTFPYKLPGNTDLQIDKERLFVQSPLEDAN